MDESHLIFIKVFTQKISYDDNNRVTSGNDKHSFVNILLNIFQTSKF